jgi:hypothetical protein
MSRFVVKFMKDVLGENGREAEICQGTLEVDASNEGQATELAKGNSAKRRRFATGRFMPTGSMSRRPIFPPERPSRVRSVMRAQEIKAAA